jgi:uncharacterized protein YlbG (UPF0298 family)
MDSQSKAFWFDSDEQQNFSVLTVQNVQTNYILEQIIRFHSIKHLSWAFWDEVNATRFQDSFSRNHEHTCIQYSSNIYSF